MPSTSAVVNKLFQQRSRKNQAVAATKHSERGSCPSMTSTSRSSSSWLERVSLRSLWMKRRQRFHEKATAVLPPVSEIVFAADQDDDDDDDESVSALKEEPCPEWRDILSLFHSRQIPQSPKFQSLSSSSCLITPRVPFWTSNPVRLLVACALLAILLQCRLPIYVAIIFECGSIVQLLTKWKNYFNNQTDALVAWRQRQGLLRIFRRHSELVLNGHYARRVLTGYFIHTLTHPGKTLLTDSVRCRTKGMNQSWISELSDRHGLVGDAQIR